MGRNLGNVPSEIRKWPSHAKGKESPENAADLPGQGGGRFNTEGTYKACPQRPQHEATSAPPGRRLNVCLETLTEFSHLYHPDRRPSNTSLSPRCVLQNGARCGDGGRKVPSKSGERGKGTDKCAGPVCRRVNPQSRFLHDLFHHMMASML